jgi:hypothetical protein
MTVKWGEGGKIKKDGIGHKRSHLLDCLRYYVSTHWQRFLK